MYTVALSDLIDIVRKNIRNTEELSIDEFFDLFHLEGWKRELNETEKETIKKNMRSFMARYEDMNSETRVLHRYRIRKCQGEEFLYQLRDLHTNLWRKYVRNDIMSDMIIFETESRFNYLLKSPIYKDIEEKMEETFAYIMASVTFTKSEKLATTLFMMTDKRVLNEEHFKTFFCSIDEHLSFLYEIYNHPRLLSRFLVEYSVKYERMEEEEMTEFSL
jgi:hypothetical protein